MQDQALIKSKIHEIQEKLRMIFSNQINSQESVLRLILQLQTQLIEYQRLQEPSNKDAT